MHLFMLILYALKVKIPATVTDRKSHQYDIQTKYFKFYRRPYCQEQLVVKSIVDIVNTSALMH